jgi:hypothetical protein
VSLAACRFGLCLRLRLRSAGIRCLPALSALLFLAAAMTAGCGSASLKGVPSGAIVGRPNLYDYSPSVIQTGSSAQVWWCGFAQNPENSSQTSDTIQYSTIDLTTGNVSDPVTVMGETPGAWDSAYICNPQVVEGTFADPLGDGRTYTYAMYYVGTALESGFANSIGVAFSNDGLHWNKDPQPVIRTGTQIHYGVGQPAPYNSDQKSGIWLFYEDSNAASGAVHQWATSADGVHFTLKGQLTTQGLNPNYPLASWGDMAYDPETHYFYAVFNMNLRQPWTTGNEQERGQLGVTLYRIPEDSLLSGVTPWQELHSFDTNATGYESNFIAGFVRDGYGNVNVGAYPSIQLFTSISNPRAAWDATPASRSSTSTPNTWDVGVDSWTPGRPLLALNRYRNASVHEVTTGYIDPNGGFTLESTLGHLYEGPQNGANLALYACRSGNADFFVSSDHDCEDKLVLGLEGYAYAQAPAGQTTVPLYRCATGNDHFVSTDPKCEGHAQPGQLLGYALP